MNPTLPPSQPQPEHICLECGLCCNGVIFADVTLQAGDDPRRLELSGLKVRNSNCSQPKRQAIASNGPDRLLKLPQPCAAFDGCRCRIYSDRPIYCRQFECLLLKRIKSGDLDMIAARRIISQARRVVDKAERLLSDLGDAETQMPLRARFHETSRNLESKTLDKHQRESYGQLTLAMHELACLLSDQFYR